MAGKNGAYFLDAARSIATLNHGLIESLKARNPRVFEL